MSNKNTEPLILITNDDGVDSKGLEVILKIVNNITSNYIVVAPTKNCSGFGHSITLSRPIRLYKLREKLYSCDGSPTDCVMIALSEILKNKKPDLLISGVNIGENIGDDVSYSGTVGAALEGAFSGIKSIAISKNRPQHNDKDDWSGVEEFIPDFIESFIKNKDMIININIPNISSNDIKGTIYTKLARRKPMGKFLYRKDSKGTPYYWLTTDRSKVSLEPNTDIWALENNYISLTPLCLDMTDKNYLKNIWDENNSK